MSDDLLDELRERLLTDPFDEQTRLQFARLLGETEQHAEALAQFELVLKTDSESVPALQGAALCRVALGDHVSGLDLYTKSKNLPGFKVNEELEGLLRNAQATRPTLSVVEGTASVVPMFESGPDRIGFADVAGMETLKKTLRLQIIEPFRNPGVFQRFRRQAGGGVLLYGPPGCGKTMMARAVATECNAAFIQVGISDVLNMWIGESEKNLAVLFDEARARRPCVMFFDELDALAYSRSKSSSHSSRTVVNEFLAQLDGFGNDNKDVLILAATNMPWDVDPAMKRPGRFSRMVFVPPPDTEARADMLTMKLEDVPVEPGLDVNTLAASMKFFSGADIDGVIERAKDSAIADMLDGAGDRALAMDDFRGALEDFEASTIDWLKTARNLVKFSGADSSYKAVEKYLKKIKMY